MECIGSVSVVHRFQGAGPAGPGLRAPGLV